MKIGGRQECRRRARRKRNRSRETISCVVAPAGFLHRVTEILPAIRRGRVARQVRQQFARWQRAVCVHSIQPPQCRESIVGITNAESAEESLDTRIDGEAGMEKEGRKAEE